MAAPLPIPEEADATAGDEIKPYRLQWSNRRLDLTRQKLELTRLPHEGGDSPAEDWWEPKPQIEFLIDYWLERYSWRAQERDLNGLPQFRTSISVPAFGSATPSETSLRLHFIHARSTHADAIPLLLIPPFPLTNLSLAHLLPALTNPDAPEQNQPFHVVIPSLPGLGFSDALPNNLPMIAATASMLDTLMVTRLEYPRYVVTGAGAGTASPAGIDWRIVARLAEFHTESCIGAHLIAPALKPPVMNKDPWEWAKWRLAVAFGVQGLGYTEEDVAALKRVESRIPPSSSPSSIPAPSKAGPNETLGTGGKKKKKVADEEIALDALALREPNTLAYALCDSPTGLLAFVLKTLHLVAGPGVGAAPGGLTPDQILTMTNLAWLPGPEAVMRFWAYCSARQNESDDREDLGKSAPRSGTNGASKPKVAITVFLGDEKKSEGQDADETTTTVPAPEDATPQQPAQPTTAQAEPAGSMPRIPLPKSATPPPDRYICPAWGNIRFDVLHSQRVTGRPGLLAFERPDVITTGIRGLVKQIEIRDTRAFRAPAAEATSPLEQVVVVGEEGAPLVTVAKPEPAHVRPAADAGAAAEVGSAAVPKIAEPSETQGSPATLAAPAPAARSTSDGLLVPSPLSSGNESTPDTLVVSTPPLSVKPSP